MKIKVYRGSTKVADYNGTAPSVGDIIRTFYSTNIYSGEKDLFPVVSVIHDAEDETAIVRVGQSIGTAKI